jgi:hypothetical protein
MTRRIGKSFVQLLTRRAVLIALGLAGEGGEGGCEFKGVVEDLRGGKGGGRLWAEGCGLFRKVDDPLEDAGRLDLDGAEADVPFVVPCCPEEWLGGNGTGVDGSERLYGWL